MPPNLTGYYRFVSQENMDNYLRALGNSAFFIPLLSPSCFRLQKCQQFGRGGGVLGTLWSFCLRPSLLCCGVREEKTWLELPDYEWRICGDAVREGVQVIHRSPLPLILQISM